MIVTLTMNPTIDASTTTSHVEPDRKLRCAEPVREPGGGGLNVSRAIKNLGGESVAIWTSGGLTGKLLDELLRKEGIDHRAIHVPGLTRENLIVYEKSTGRQYRFGMPGPHMIADEACRVCEMLRSFDMTYLVASGSLPPGLGDGWYGRIAKCAAAQNARFILDTHGSALQEALKVGAWLIKPNHRELCELTGCDIENEQQLEVSARRLIQDGSVEHVLVSLGAAGAILVSAEGSAFLRSPTVPIRSVVGAGDSMLAGLTWSLYQGHDIQEAARYAVAAGAAAVMTPGTGLCRREDVDRLYEGSKLVAT